MNIPSTYRKAVGGFIIPPRSFFQMFVSASKGAYSLTDEKEREKFIKKLEKGTINESVIAQASSGPMMMLSLYNDLKNPLFKKCDFDPSQFLEGVGPALENYHNLSGALENELHRMLSKVKEDGSDESNEKSDEESDEVKVEIKGLSKEERDAITSTISMIQKNLSPGQKLASAVLEHDWMDDTKKDPDSMAGQLSQMLTEELFGHFQLSAKSAFLLRNQSKQLMFDEGSCTVNNVALLSARAFRCIEEPGDESSEDENPDGPRYEIVDDDAEVDQKESGVAAQIEVLYDVTSHFSIDKDKETSDDD